MAGAVAAVRRTVTGGGTDGITLLETDHKVMKDLLKRAEGSSERSVQKRRQLLDAITAELAVHETLEERVLYPTLERHPEAREVVLEGFQEHHVADLLVKELHEVAPDDERWRAKLTALKENIEHHIQEEEGRMFRTARGVLSQDELDAMGAKMASMKQKTRRS